MKEILDKVIRKILFPKYSKLTELEIERIELSSGDVYFANFITSECLTTQDMMDIDTEVKTLYAMLPKNENTKFLIENKKIKATFDCGDGEGPKMEYFHNYKY